MINSSVKMINLYNKVKNNPELLQLLESAKELKLHDIEYIIEEIEYKKHKELTEANGRKTRYQIFRRIDIDWNKLSEAIKSRGYSYSSIAEKIGVSNSVLYNSKKQGKMNPFLFEEICDLLSITAQDYCTSIDYIRLRNGRSKSKRIRVNWKLIYEDAKNKGYTITNLSKAINKSEGYLTSCKRLGGLYEDTLKQIGKILNRDYKNYYIDEIEKNKKLIDDLCDYYNVE